VKRTVAIAADPPPSGVGAVGRVPHRFVRSAGLGEAWTRARMQLSMVFGRGSRWLSGTIPWHSSPTSTPTSWWREGVEPGLEGSRADDRLNPKGLRRSPTPWRTPAVTGRALALANSSSSTPKVRSRRSRPESGAPDATVEAMDPQIQAQSGAPHSEGSRPTTSKRHDNCWRTNLTGTTGCGFH
jgi:hypothetical protein